MNTLEEIDRLTKAHNQYRWALANLAVAAICVTCAAYVFYSGHLLAGFIVVLVSFLVVLNVNSHERKARHLKG